MPSKNHRVKKAYVTYVGRFIKFFDDCEFTYRCAIVAAFMGAYGYLHSEVWDDHGEGLVFEQKFKKLFAWFEKEGRSIEYQLAVNDFILRSLSDAAESEKYNDTAKHIFTHYLKEKREETAAALYSAGQSGQYFGLSIMEENPEEYRQEILHFVKCGCGFIRNRLLEILYRQKNWEDNIIALLSSKKRDIRALAVDVLMYWQNEGADYTEVFTSMLEREKTAKVRGFLQEALK